MRKTILALLLLTFSYSSFAQLDQDEWYLSVGVNAINSLGTQSPFNSPQDWAFNIPISVAAEYSWNRQWSVEQALTINKFTTGNKFDGTVLEEDLSYISFDSHVKYYFGQYLFPNTDWIDLYVDGGLGFFHIDETNISANLGGGILFWLNPRKSFGIRTQFISKFAINHKSSGYDNNHYQFHLEAVIRL